MLTAQQSSSDFPRHAEVYPLEVDGVLRRAPTKRGGLASRLRIFCGHLARASERVLPELPHELMAVGGLLAAAIAFVATIVWLYRRTVSRGAMRVRGAFAALDDIELLDLSTATREGLSALARVGAHPDAELWIEGAFLRVQKIGFLDDVEVLDALVRAAGTIAVALGRSDATR